MLCWPLLAETSQRAWTSGLEKTGQEQRGVHPSKAAGRQKRLSGCLVPPVSTTARVVEPSAAWFDFLRRVQRREKPRIWPLGSPAKLVTKPLSPSLQPVWLLDQAAGGASAPPPWSLAYPPVEPPQDASGSLQELPGPLTQPSPMLCTDAALVPASIAMVFAGGGCAWCGHLLNGSVGLKAT